MSEPSTPPLNQRHRQDVTDDIIHRSEKRQMSNSRRKRHHQSKKKRSRRKSSTSSSTSSESDCRHRKSRSVYRKKRQHVRSKSSSTSIDSSVSKTCKRSRTYSSSKRQSLKTSNASTSDPVLLQLVAAIEGKQRAVQGYSGQNVIPEFDPQAKTQSIKDWLSKINETAAVYGWSEKQIIYYSIPRLAGLSKRWYDGLTTIKFSWDEWQRKLLKAFHCEDNYGDLLTEMLSRKSRRNETLEEYYYDKLRLINHCKIEDLKAVDCLIHGIYDNNIKMNAQGLCFNKPEDLLSYFKKLNSNIRDSRTDRPPMVTRKPINFTPTPEETLKRQNDICFNCKEKGHFWQKCPKDLMKCGKCRRVGHYSAKCNFTSADTDKSSAGIY